MIIANFLMPVMAPGPQEFNNFISRYTPCNLHLLDGELTIQFAHENQDLKIDSLNESLQLLVYKVAINALLKSNVCDALNVETITKLRDELRYIKEKVQNFKHALQDLIED